MILFNSRRAFLLHIQSKINLKCNSQGSLKDRKPGWSSEDGGIGCLTTRCKVCPSSTSIIQMLKELCYPNKWWMYLRIKSYHKMHSVYNQGLGKSHYRNFSFFFFLVKITNILQFWLFNTIALKKWQFLLNTTVRVKCENKTFTTTRLKF